MCRFLKRQNSFPYPILNGLGASSEVPCSTIYERNEETLESSASNKVPVLRKL